MSVVYRGNNFFFIYRSTRKIIITIYQILHSISYCITTLTETDIIYCYLMKNVFFDIFFGTSKHIRSQYLERQGSLNFKTVFVLPSFDPFDFLPFPEYLTGIFLCLLMFPCHLSFCWRTTTIAASRKKGSFFSCDIYDIYVVVR